MPLFGGLEKLKERALYIRLRNAPFAELLKAVKTDSRTYNPVIRILTERKNKIDEDYKRLQSKRNKQLREGIAKSLSKKFDDLSDRDGNLTIYANECFNTILENNPEYVDKAIEYRAGRVTELSISPRVLKSIPPFEESNSPLLKLVSHYSYTDYLCQMLRGDHSLSEKAYTYLISQENKHEDNYTEDQKLCNTQIAKTLLDINPDMVDKFIQLLSDEKYKVMFNEDALMHSIAKFRPEYEKHETPSEKAEKIIQKAKEYGNQAILDDALYEAKSAVETKMYLDAGADPNAEDDTLGQSALMGANDEKTELLLEAGADPYVVSIIGGTALDGASERKINLLKNALLRNPKKLSKMVTKAKDHNSIKILQQLINQANQRRIEMVKPTEFMYINPAMKNPKTGENVREQETAKLESLKAEGKKIVGLEMTVADLAGICDKNIDPQHTDGKADECCAKTVAENAATLLADYRGQDVVFVTNRVDLDSVAAYVMADRYLQGKTTEYNDNLAQINDHDAHLGARWEGPKPIEQAFDPDNKTAALASSIKVFMVTPKNIEDVRNFIDTGNVEETVMNNYRTVQNGIIDRVKSGEIKTEVVGGVAYVETTLPCATNVGYSMAPVVVAVNPAMKLGPQGEPFRKVSICQHEAGYADLNAVADKLNEMEAGWGGSPTFKGSKQGESCNISLSDIKKTVFAHLTPEYKAKVTSNVGNANSGKGMEE